jgi:IclR family pca regulon transcriptional regulator
MLSPNPTPWFPRETQDETSDAFIQSLARGLAVLTAFKAGHERLTMAEVAKATGLTRASARRILLTLEHLGYVSLDRRLFFLTAQVLDLVSGYSAQPLWEKTHKVLQALAKQLDETVSAGILDGHDVVYTVRVRSSHLLHLELKEGTRLPAHASSMGRILLAALPPGSLERFLRTSKLAPYTPQTVTDPAVLRQRLKEAQHQGWCVARDEIVEGICCVSVPLVDSSGKTLAALSASISSKRATMQLIGGTIVPALREAAESINAIL